MLTYAKVIVTPMEGYTFLEGRNSDIREWLNANGDDVEQYVVWRGLNGANSFQGNKYSILARIGK